MDTNRLKTFAQRTRIDLMSQVGRKLDAALALDSAERREAPGAIQTLEHRIGEIGRPMVIEQVAYTWFNRITALRYMDASGILAPMLVSPALDRTRPEILDQAVAGAIPDYVRPPIATRIGDLLEGRAPSREPQVEAYRLLLVAACNDLSRVMPFLFESIANYTELLMPNELLAADGWVARMRDVMTEDACQDVEIIGWLYQFYISEKKDQVFAGLKKNQKITAENIPAATQLFTPHWIVRYLVENSLGRLWLLNRPGSRLAERMEYYIAPEEPETDFLRISGPQEIRICDPACGSGHMLTYAFDLLYAIYEEEGFPPAEIPDLILTHNVTGVEIDDRAGALAAFALAMKAAAKLGRRRFMRMEVKPDVVVLKNVEFTGQDRLGEFLRMIGQGANSALADTLAQFGQAKNFGSLIVPKLKNPGDVLEALRATDLREDIVWKGVWERVVAVLRMAEALAPRYHVVVANPPYMGSKGMNGPLGDFAKAKYPDSKSDLFAMFMERTLAMTLKRGMMAMINMQSWMFLSSYEKLRGKLLSNATLLSMAHLGERGFDTIGGAVVSTTAFVFGNASHPVLRGDYVRLIYGASESEKALQMREAIKNRDCGYLFRAPSADFEKIPGSPVAYWLSQRMIDSFKSGKLGALAEIKGGMSTSNNNRFLRNWSEVSLESIGHVLSEEQAKLSRKKWFPYNKGGSLRKWYGNKEYVVNWLNDGAEIKHAVVNNPSDPNTTHWSRRIFNTEYFFKNGLTWGDINTDLFSARLLDAGAISDSVGIGAYNFKDTVSPLCVLGLLNSKVFGLIAEVLCPSLHFNSGPMSNVPVISECLNRSELINSVMNAKEIGQSDWDSYETSWDFTTLPLLSLDHRSGTLEETYARLRAHWAGMTEEMQRLEEENNRIFIDAYGLQDELTPGVPIEEITLTCNPAYRYGVKGTEEEREGRLLADTMKELISYAIGCMFGRYSLDAPGLILANQGETVQTYLDRIPNPSFAADRDNVIPLFEEDWFADDAYQQFREFLSVTFGADRLVENLEFMRQALGKEVRTYLARDFYADHVQRYKKRPIYWLVSSPKGAFQALIYMHRYTPDTLNIALNDYVRGLRDRLEAGLRSAKALEINLEASPAERNRAKRDIDRFTKQIAEVTEWERDTLYPLVIERVQIDLDDGVKRNYPKFPGVLRPIKGLEDEDA
ncbi:BREX-1 system adenine-specific DNA-methyltransferase PglX [Tabrizicola sp. BL-A-41-H6]|uniref:BREX-1 system adenine-specific DNA-methyltransferase PglX n=1 Tax=Tabrizicola sp. BL-A-41-H6 TaxID=3421107 RepID=UPI003D66E38A